RCPPPTRPRPPALASFLIRRPGMIRSATPRWIAALTIGMTALMVPASSRGDGFDRNVRPLLQGHCLRCHGGEKPKGAVNLARFGDEEAVRGDPELWLRVVDALEERTMPPPGNRAGPNEDERQRGAASIRAILEAREGIRDPGPSLIQRLT